MSNERTQENYRAELQEAAIRRFGEERARVLEPDVEEIAASLATVADFRTGPEEEPAFFL
jgi:hypothetical protein